MPNKKHRGLGRGLSALMADVGEMNAPRGESGSARPENLIAIDLIHPNPDQPRRHFDEDSLNDLAESIRAKGVIQPLIIRADPKQAGHFQIVAGERRWRAAQLAELHELPVIIREFTDTEMLEVAIIENIQREDLNAIDEARSYQQLMDRFGHTQDQVASGLGKSRSHIANMVRLLGLPEQVRAFVVDGNLSAGHARTLVGKDDALELAHKIISKGLSVREAERLSKPAQARTKSAPKEKDADTRQIEQDLAAHLKMRVQINHAKTGEGGQLVLGYKDLEQLDSLLNLLSGN